MAKYSTGSAAPTSIPTEVGEIYKDTSSGIVYQANGIIGAGDWEIIEDPTGALAAAAALISDTAYDATSWNAVTGIAPSKNAVRDQVETMLTSISDKASSSSLTSGLALKLNVSNFSVGFAALNAATTGVAALFGTAIPDNAIIKQVYYDVVSTFIDNGTAGDADSATIKIGLEDQDNDVLAAVAISDGGNPFDAGIHAGIQVGTAATMIKLSAARQLAVTWTAGTGDSTALTAGAMNVFVEWVQGA